MPYIFIFIFLVFSSFQGFAQESAQKVDSPFSNLYQVSDSIYRSEQPDSLGIEFLKENNFKSVLNIKTKQTDTVFETGNLNMYFVKLHAECLNKQKIIEALRVLRDAPKPLVIHCRSGSDRTGLIIALYRIIDQGYSKDEAIEEMKYGGFGFHSIFWNIPRFIKKLNIEELKKEI